MAKTFFLLFLFTLSYSSFAQLDVLRFKKVQIGVIYDRTNFTGVYTLKNDATGEALTNQKDYISTINAEIKHVVSSETGVFTGNMEGFLYLFGRLASMKGKKELFYDWDSYLDPLTAGDLHNVALPSGSGYKDIARVTNNHLFDGTASWSFKRNGAGFMGINLGGRLIGFPPRYTFYPTASPENHTLSASINGTFKLLYGLNGGFRANLGKKAALFFIAGVNRGINKSGGQTSTAIQVLYNPFFNPTLYFGGKYGGYLGFYWEYMKGKDQEVRFTRKQPIGTPEFEETKTNEISSTQFQIKGGFYFSLKGE